ncbi:MAG: hypothetical protein F8N37_21540 [Telmatospirillum sp.]|nr:hypothetical protein [Telmatospirillum sp.]
MFKFIGRALAGLFLTREARDAVGQIQMRPPAHKTKPMSPFEQRDAAAAASGGKALSPSTTLSASKAEAIAAAQEEAQALVTPDRAELIRQAMRVRAAKQAILADLDDETRGKLVATAMKALLRENRRDE